MPLSSCRYYANAGNDAVYRDFPHEFKCKITYRLTAEGLEQEVVFFNRSETRIPLGVGFHTPLTIPFAGGTDAVLFDAVEMMKELLHTEDVAIYSIANQEYARLFSKPIRFRSPFK